MLKFNALSCDGAQSVHYSVDNKGADIAPHKEMFVFSCIYLYLLVFTCISLAPPLPALQRQAEVGPSWPTSIALRLPADSAAGRYPGAIWRLRLPLPLRTPLLRRTARRLQVAISAQPALGDQ